MTILFTENELNNWANYSGDWNPIHFELDKSKALGCENLIVHGMLVLTRLLYELSSSSLNTKPASPDRWLSIKASFKNPAEINKVITINLSDLNNQVKFQAFDEENLLVKGKQNYQSPPKGNTKHLKNISCEKLNANINEYCNFFSKEAPLLIWLNAFTFSIFIKELLIGLPSRISSTLTSRNHVSVQTTQKIYIHPEWQKKFIKNFTFTEDISISMEISPAIEDTNHVSSEVFLQVEYKGENIFIQEIGILATTIN